MMIALYIADESACIQVQIVTMWIILCLSQVFHMSDKTNWESWLWELSTQRKNVVAATEWDLLLPQQSVEIQQQQQQQQFESSISSSFQQQSTVTSSSSVQQVLNGSFEVSQRAQSHPEN